MYQNEINIKLNGSKITLSIKLNKRKLILRRDIQWQFKRNKGEDQRMKENISISK